MVLENNRMPPILMVLIYINIYKIYNIKTIILNGWGKIKKLDIGITKSKMTTNIMISHIMISSMTPNA